MYTTGIALTGTADIPAYVTGTISAASQTALYGGRGFAWTVINSGVLAGGQYGYGVWTESGSSVTNASSGTITGGRGGVYIYLGAGTVVNAGTIEATGARAGVNLTVGGSVTNQSGGYIRGNNGLYIFGGVGALSNAGTIVGTAGTGVNLSFNSPLTNTASGVITGATTGVYLGSSGRLMNSGSIGGGTAVGQLGVSADYARLTNQSGGVITGYDAIYAKQQSTITNAGSIAGTHDAIRFATNSGGRLVVDVGAVFSGVVDGSDTPGAKYPTIIELPSSATVGTLSGLGSQFVNFARVAVDAGATWTFTNSEPYAGTLTNGGTVQGSIGSVAGELQFAAGYPDRFAVEPGAAPTAMVDGGNTVGATAVSTLELASGSSPGTLSGLGTRYVNFAAVTVDFGASWLLNGNNALPANGALYSGGTLALADTFANAGSINARYGLKLAAGAYLTNASGATIEAIGNAAIYGSTIGAPTFVNAGVVSNVTHISSSGVLFEDGGAVSNLASGTISGVDMAVGVYGAPGTISNFGTIVQTYTSRDGIFLAAGGLVTNAAGGLITANGAGAVYSNGVATVINAGVIADSAVGHDGIQLVTSGSVINLVSGVIRGYDNAIAGYNTAATVTNFGTIVGYGTLSDGVILNAGGSVTNAAGGTIAVTTSSTFAGVGVYYNAGTVTNAGLIVSASGPGVYLGAGGVVVNVGTISGGPDAVTLAASQTNRLVVDPGAVFTGIVDGGNTIGAKAISTLELASAATAGTLSGVGSEYLNFGSITFDTGAEWLLAGSTAGLASGQTISNFTGADTIQLTGLTETVQSYSGGVLSLIGDVSVSLNLPGSFTTASFVATPVAGSTDITLACFAAGTRVRTERGEIAVERLRVGERVVTVSGSAQPIVWIGRRTVRCARHPSPVDVRPVRISAGAFGPGQPCRNLLLSPDHAVYASSVLIPVRHLINGSTIVQVPCDEVEYYHVELPRHDVLLAEGLSVESYLDTGARSNFINGDATVRLHPDFSARVWEAFGCAPLVVTGSKLAVVRRKLKVRARRPAVAARLLRRGHA
jgi:hypothetical protein